MNIVISDFQVTHSFLDPTQIGKFIKSQFNLRGKYTCRYFYQGTNDIYKWQNATATYYARITRSGYRSQENIAVEMDLLSLWSKKGIHVAAPLTNAKGEPTIKIDAPEGPRFLNLFTEAKGMPTADPSKDELIDIGRNLGSIHRIAERVPPQKEIPFTDVEQCTTRSCTEICKILKQDSEIRKHIPFFENLSSKLKKHLSQFPLEKLSWGILHGDFVVCNIHVDSDGKATIFDFDRIAYGWHAYEVGAYIGHLANNRNIRTSTSYYSTLVERFTEGYESIKPLSALEKDMFPLFHIMRRMQILSFCCTHYETWSNRFLHPKSWNAEVSNLKQWTQRFQLFEF